MSLRSCLILTPLFQSLTKVLKNVQNRAKPEAFILIVILPNSAGPIRNAVKHWGDVRYGTSRSI